MPRVKIDYVVSFSSESPEAPASNLLANEAGHGRWLCAKGEPSCSVLLQLTKAVQISSLTIGAHHAALVEVLVGKSETPNEPFQVLVASSMFLSPLESRRLADGEAAAARVRSFSGAQLAADVAARRWDRVRVVCSQPYNKHCKYGLSFIHIFTPEGESEASNPPEKPSALPMNLQLDDPESEDDDLKPGALFAKYRQTQSQAQDSSGSTDAQIRQATSKVLKHASDASAKLVRTPISKPKETAGERVTSDRRSEKLMYDEEDAQPNAKIDRLVNAHKDQQAKTSAEKASKEEKHKEKTNKPVKDKSDSDTHNRDKNRNDTTLNSSKDKDKKRDRDSESHRKERDDRSKTPQSNKRERTSSKKHDDRDSKKPKLAKEDSDNVLYAGPVSDAPHTLLSDVHFALSGYENPRRGQLRDAALAMGAHFHRDWGPQCTHLICAFPNTPKLKTVRASPNGQSAVVVTGEWLQRCAARRRRLPWQWFATEDNHKVQRARSASGEDPPGTSGIKTPDPPESSRSKSPKIDEESPKAAPDSECDTDDEIERVLAKKKRRHSSDERDTAISEESAKKKKKEEVNSSRDSDVAFVRDERMQGNVTVSDEDSDDTTQKDTAEDPPQDLDSIGLPALFEGLTFAFLAGDRPLLDVKLLTRYIRAYGGEIVEPQDDEDVEVDYVLCLSGVPINGRVRGPRLRGDWLWRCHEKRRLCSPGEFAL